MITLFEIINILIIIGVTVYFLTSELTLMSHGLISFLVISLAVMFFIFTGFIWKEKVHDERDQIHLMRSTRFAYLLGIAVLIIGITYQTTMHDFNTVDPWLVITLAIMLLTKVLSLVYHRIKM